MQRLVEAGTMHERSVTIFPSITPAATTSIVTGCYPAEHGIAGASWFDQQREEIAYYGDDFWVIAREGFGEFIRDFLMRLNGERLTAPTLFEMVERTGRTAACLNYLVFRGLSAHKVSLPAALTALPGVPFTGTVEGPSVLSLGDFVGPRTPHGRRLAEKSGLFHRVGMDDASTGAMLRTLMNEGSLADITVAYFADNDYRSHEVGPHAALDVIARVDQMLAEAFEAGGGLDEVLRDTYVIITSDHGHCEVLADTDRSVIHLDGLLAGFRQAELARAWKPSDEIMICPNMRAAQIYLQQPRPERAQRIVDDLLSDPRVDMALWRSDLIDGGEAGYTAASRRGTLGFERAKGGSMAGSVTDSAGASWTWKGAPSTLDMNASDGRVRFNLYPNAFERIAGVLDLDKAGEIWVTAAPGCEFQVPGGDAHAGGASHGALHALDSYSPVIVAGPSRVSLPRHMRSVDIAPLCMQLLGVDMRYKVGQPR
jgi:hypothetical protein